MARSATPWLSSDAHQVAPSQHGIVATHRDGVDVATSLILEIQDDFSLWRDARLAAKVKRGPGEGLLTSGSCPRRLAWLAVSEGVGTWASGSRNSCANAPCGAIADHRSGQPACGPNDHGIVSNVGKSRNWSPPDASEAGAPLSRRGSRQEMTGRHPRISQDRCHRSPRATLARAPALTQHRIQHTWPRTKNCLPKGTNWNN